MSSKYFPDLRRAAGSKEGRKEVLIRLVCNKLMLNSSNHCIAFKVFIDPLFYYLLRSLSGIKCQLSKSFRLFLKQNQLLSLNCLGISPILWAFSQLKDTGLVKSLGYFYNAGGFSFGFGDLNSVHSKYVSINFKPHFYPFITSSVTAYLNICCLLENTGEAKSLAE